MSANTEDYDFDDLDKPGAERSRRRRGEDDLQSDFEEDLLEEDWLSAKKNSSEVSDEELNDDLLQSDEEDYNATGQDISLNATYDSAFANQQSGLQEAGYSDTIGNHGSEYVEEENDGEESYQQEQEAEYGEEYNQGDTAVMDYPGEMADDGYQDEVLDIEINEPIDGEFQEEDYQMSYDNERHGGDEVQQEDPGELMGEEQHDKENSTVAAQVYNTEEGDVQEETKEESDEEDEEDEESGRIRFKSERKEGAVVRLADAGSTRRNIPETLELSEKAKQDLMEFEEQERQKRQNRHGSRGSRGGGGGRGGRGRGGFPGFGMQEFRGGNRGRMNDRPPLMGNIGMQPSPRMPPPHQQPLQSQQHHSSRLRGPSSFQEHGRSSQTLQPLIHPHMSHRSSPIRPQMEPPRMMNSPPPNFPQHHQQQPPQPKNIHINPHFRGPASSSMQVPLMPPAQSQPRHAVGPQRFPGHGDFGHGDHVPGNFGQPQRSNLMEPFRSQLPQAPPDREPLFRGDCLDSSRFAGQPMFDHQGPTALMSSSNLHPQPPHQSHMGFGPPGPGFNQPAQRQLGLFAREPPRSSLPPHQNHQGMMNLNQQGGPPTQPRPFMGPRQPFGQQGNLFPPPQVQFGMQGLMHSLPASQIPHHNPMSSHQPMNQPQQHHRQELPHHHHHHQQQQQNLSEPHPMMHHGPNPFHQQQAHCSPRQMTPRLQSPQQRNMSNRQRMNTPISKQMQPRNSNLRELPVAPGNTSNARSATVPASTNIRPVAKATQAVRPGQNPQWRSDAGRGRGQVTARPESRPGAGGGTASGQEIQRSLSSVKPQDPEEDEETRQYRLKIEEQKRLREEILKKKEMRRQMQAGVRKKELIERLNSQTNAANQCPSKVLPAEASTPQMVQAPPPPQQPPKPQQQPLQQRQFPQRAPQQFNHIPQNPIQGNISQVQTLNPRPNVKSRLQMGKGNGQQQTPSGLVPDQQMMHPKVNPHQEFQQRRNPAQPNINTTGAPIPTLTVPQQNIPVHPPDSLTQGLKAGAKRTVMQRAKNVGFEGQQVPQKVRVVKLSAPAGVNPEVPGGLLEQQGNWPAPLFNNSIQRKVTMVGQPGPGGAPQPNRAGNPAQNRVVMSSRGRGRGSSQMGRGRPLSTRQGPKSAESERCTVSIEGLSSSTTDNQLKNLLRSIGPIEMFKMMPQQRKAVAKFSSPEHAVNFQISFHRHMIDLSHIDVSLIDG